MRTVARILAVLSLLLVGVGAVVVFASGSDGPFIAKIIGAFTPAVLVGVVSGILFQLTKPKSQL